MGACIRQLHILLEDLVGLIKCEALAQPDATIHPRTRRDGRLLLRDPSTQLIGDLLIGQPRQTHGVFGDLNLGEVAGTPGDVSDMHTLDTVHDVKHTVCHGATSNEWVNNTYRLVSPCTQMTDGNGQRWFTPLFHPVKGAALEAHRPCVNSAATRQWLLSCGINECPLRILIDDLGQCTQCMYTTADA